MAIAIHDAFASSWSLSDADSDLGMSYTVTSGAEVLFVFAGTDAPDDFNVVCADSLDTLTLLGEVPGTVAGGPNQPISVYYKMNPTTGARTVSMTSNGLGVSVWVAAITFSGGVSSLGTPVIDDGNATTISSTVSTPGSSDLVVDFVCVNANPTLSQGAGQTDATGTPVNYSGATGLTIGVSTQPGTAGGVMSWTLSGSQRTGQVAVTLVASAAAKAQPLFHTAARFVRRSF